MKRHMQPYNPLYLRIFFVTIFIVQCNGLGLHSIAGNEQSIQLQSPVAVTGRSSKSLNLSMLGVCLAFLIPVHSVPTKPLDKACEAGAAGHDALPTVDVIIPTYNRFSSLQRAISSVEHQDYPRSRLHTYVVDDASTDPRYREYNADSSAITWLKQRRSSRAQLGHPSAAFIRKVGGVCVCVFFLLEGLSGYSFGQDIA